MRDLLRRVERRSGRRVAPAFDTCGGVRRERQPAAGIAGL